MTAVDPADALQVGVYELLAADTTLDNLTRGVFDGVPVDETLAPGEGWVVIGEMTATPDGAHGKEGRQTSVVLHTWTRAESHRKGNQIGARLVALLWHRHADLDPHVTGHKVSRIDHEFSQTLVDPEPGIRHRIDRFRVWTQED